MANPTVLITGASSGIGLALAHEFSRRGRDLILVARRLEQLEALAGTLKRANGTAVSCIPLDLAGPNAARVLFDEIASRNGVVDTLVNNAGRGDFGAFAEQDWQRDEETIRLNVSVLTSLCHLAIPGMLERGQGRILNVASIAGFMPGPNLAVYHATKAYVLSLSRALHAELAGRGVTVTASCPGPTASEFFEKAGTQTLKALDYIKLMPAETVARQAVDALEKGQPVVVHGLLNRLMAESPRLLPQSWVAPIVRTFMK